MRLMYDAREPAVVVTRLNIISITEARGDDKDRVISCDDSQVKLFQRRQTRAIPVCTEKNSDVFFHTML